ncbi:hypothetical protein AAEU32_04195 [Pseudoalteromonas sp. SSDWG2]|uniref:hypothetical protein n=1 Tax=Pseudoalteromonas sp. SSDWG2 TaxID=3139391 RepID=UPI003BAD649E
MNYKHITLKTLFAVGALCTTSLVVAANKAEPECVHADTTPQGNRSYTQCLDKQLDAKKRQWQAWQNKRQLELEGYAKSSGITQPLDIYLRAEKTYKHYVEDSCRWRYLRVMPNAVAAAIAYKKCELRLIEQRIEAYQVPLD